MLVVSTPQKTVHCCSFILVTFKIKKRLLSSYFTVALQEKYLMIANPVLQHPMQERRSIQYDQWVLPIQIPQKAKRTKQMFY